jgi:hypothetical protein
MSKRRTEIRKREHVSKDMLKNEEIRTRMERHVSREKKRRKKTGEEDMCWKHVVREKEIVPKKRLKNTLKNNSQGERETNRAGQGDKCER